MAKIEKNAGKYNKRIGIYQVTRGKDSAGFPADVETLVLRVYAEVKTTKGYTIIKNDSDFEKAYTRFTIRYPVTEITYDMFIIYRNKRYEIEYINNVDNADVELELQCKEVMH